MCQCILCDCWWVNMCGICCAGWHEALLCVSCWACKPAELQDFDPKCCHCCSWRGCGGNLFCWGSVCFAPLALKTFSRLKNGSGTGNTVVITTTSR